MVFKILNKHKKIAFAGTSGGINAIIFTLTQVGLVSASNPITIPISIFCGGVSLGLLVAFASEKKVISKKDQAKIQETVQKVIDKIHSNPPFEEYPNSGIVLPAPRNSPVEEEESTGDLTHRTVVIDGEEYEIKF